MRFLYSLFGFLWFLESGFLQPQLLPATVPAAPGFCGVFHKLSQEALPSPELPEDLYLTFLNHFLEGTWSHVNIGMLTTSAMHFPCFLLAGLVCICLSL